MIINERTELLVNYRKQKHILNSFIPTINLPSFSKLIGNWERTFAARMTRKGEIGSSCQRSQDDLKKPIGPSLMRTKKVGVEN